MSAMGHEPTSRLRAGLFDLICGLGRHVGGEDRREAVGGGHSGRPIRAMTRSIVAMCSRLRTR